MITSLSKDLVRKALFDFPVAVPLDKLEKRNAGKVDASTLSEEQKIAFSQMWSFIKNSNGGMHKLLGYSGTGKTYIMSLLVEHFLDIFPGQAVAMTAPTNKAVRVMKRMAQYTHPDLVYKTIHSLLGLKEVHDDYGKSKFVRDYTEPCKLEEYKFLVLDEVSMLPDYIFMELLPFVYSGLKIIFVGDPCQINPIGLTEAIPLNVDKSLEYGIGMSELIEIRRQAGGSPIIDLSLQMRLDIHRDREFLEKTDKFNAQGGVLFLSTKSQEDGEFLDEILQRFYTSENFNIDSDFVKLIARKNDLVDLMNKKIREYVFDNPQNKIVIGERLMADTPIFEEQPGGKMKQRIVFTTNDEFIVDSFTMGEEPVEGFGVLKYYTCKVTCYDYDMPRHEEIRIIHEDSEGLYKQIMEMLRLHALSLHKGSFQQKNAWAEFFQFRDYFAAVKYVYAVTAHKSQGSTYQNVIVMGANINGLWQVLERNKMRYTAVTRAAKNVVIVS